eukprot:823180-Pelagomonas_calceolata.AAC.4
MGSKLAKPHFRPRQGEAMGGYLARWAHTLWQGILGHCKMILPGEVLWDDVRPKERRSQNFAFTSNSLAAHTPVSVDPCVMTQMLWRVQILDGAMQSESADSWQCSWRVTVLGGVNLGIRGKRLGMQQDGVTQKTAKTLCVTQ